MKYIEEKNIMLIKIFNDNDVTKMNIDEEISVFDFEALDNLIEKIVSSSADIIVNADEGLENYKTLIEELIKEIKSEDFQKALQEVNKYKSEKEDSKEENEQTI